MSRIKKGRQNVQVRFDQFTGPRRSLFLNKEDLRKVTVGADYNEFANDKDLSSGMQTHEIQLTSNNLIGASNISIENIDNEGPSKNAYATNVTNMTQLSSIEDRDRGSMSAFETIQATK